jgi:hypothetical protein
MKQKEYTNGKDSPFYQINCDWNEPKSIYARFMAEGKPELAALVAKNYKIGHKKKLTI